MKNSSRILENLAALMRYPSSQLDVTISMMGFNIAKQYLPIQDKFAYVRRAFSKMTQAEQEELYTETFDLKPQCFPYAAYHIYGEDYKRGLLMAGLKAGFAECSIDLDDDLPDYIPSLLVLYTRFSDREKASSLRDELLLPALEVMYKQIQKSENLYTRILEMLIYFLELEKNLEARQIEEASSTKRGFHHV
jgi:nitrate reductase molybdenum cofactor assembly chaperone